MRVVFVDVDGVLNSEQYYQQPSSASWPSVDPIAVGLLDRLVREAGAVVVVSSSWRGDSRVESRLRDAGFDDRIVDDTPILFGRDHGDEIAAWLEENGADVESFVILDDDDDMGALVNRLVRCDRRVGLTEREIAVALALLRRGAD
jgi:hypothetical protein